MCLDYGYFEKRLIGLQRTRCMPGQDVCLKECSTLLNAFRMEERRRVRLLHMNVLLTFPLLMVYTIHVQVLGGKQKKSLPSRYLLLVATWSGHLARKLYGC